MKKCLTVDEMLRLACIYAEQDRESYLEAVKDSDPEWAEEARRFLEQLRAYRKKRWGKTKIEGFLEGGRRKCV